MRSQELQELQEFRSRESGVAEANAYGRVINTGIRIDCSPTRILHRMEADEPPPALPKRPTILQSPDSAWRLLTLLALSYRKSRRQASTEAITPTKSANRPVGIACRVFVMPTEPK